MHVPRIDSTLQLDGSDLPTSKLRKTNPSYEYTIYDILTVFTYNNYLCNKNINIVLNKSLLYRNIYVKKFKTDTYKNIV